MIEDRPAPEFQPTWAKMAKATLDARPNHFREIAERVWAESPALKAARAGTQSTPPLDAAAPMR